MSIPVHQLTAASQQMLICGSAIRLQLINVRDIFNHYDSLLSCWLTVQLTLAAIGNHPCGRNISHLLHLFHGCTPTYLYNFPYRVHPKPRHASCLVFRSAENQFQIFGFLCLPPPVLGIFRYLRRLSLPSPKITKNIENDISCL